MTDIMIKVIYVFVLECACLLLLLLQDNNHQYILHKEAQMNYTVPDLQKGVYSPAVWQIESDAPTYMLPKAHVAYSTEADVEEGDDAHPQVQNQVETLSPVHFILQRKHLTMQQDKQKDNKQYYFNFQSKIKCCKSKYTP